MENFEIDMIFNFWAETKNCSTYDFFLISEEAVGWKTKKSTAVAVCFTRPLDGHIHHRMWSGLSHVCLDFYCKTKRTNFSCCIYIQYHEWCFRAPKDAIKCSLTDTFRVESMQTWTVAKNFWRFFVIFFSQVCSGNRSWWNLMWLNTLLFIRRIYCPPFLKYPNARHLLTICTNSVHLVLCLQHDVHLPIF